MRNKKNQNQNQSKPSAFIQNAQQYTAEDLYGISVAQTAFSVDSSSVYLTPHALGINVDLQSEDATIKKIAEDDLCKKRLHVVFDSQCEAKTSAEDNQGHGNLQWLSAVNDFFQNTRNIRKKQGLSFLPERMVISVLAHGHWWNFAIDIDIDTSQKTVALLEIDTLTYVSEGKRSVFFSSLKKALQDQLSQILPEVTLKESSIIPQNDKDQLRQRRSTVCGPVTAYVADLLLNETSLIKKKGDDLEKEIRSNLTRNLPKQAEESSKESTTQEDSSDWRSKQMRELENVKQVCGEKVLSSPSSSIEVFDKNVADRLKQELSMQAMGTHGRKINFHSQCKKLDEIKKYLSRKNKEENKKENSAKLDPTYIYFVMKCLSNYDDDSLELPIELNQKMPNKKQWKKILFDFRKGNIQESNYALIENLYQKVSESFNRKKREKKSEGDSKITKRTSSSTTENTPVLKLAEVNGDFLTVADIKTKLSNFVNVNVQTKKDGSSTVSFEVPEENAKKEKLENPEKSDEKSQKQSKIELQIDKNANAISWSQYVNTDLKHFEDCLQAARNLYSSEDEKGKEKALCLKIKFSQLMDLKAVISYAVKQNIIPLLETEKGKSVSMQKWIAASTPEDRQKLKAMISPLLKENEVEKKESEEKKDADSLDGMRSAYYRKMLNTISSVNDKEAKAAAEKEKAAEKKENALPSLEALQSIVSRKGR